MSRLLQAAFMAAALAATTPVAEAVPTPGLTALVTVRRIGLPPTPPIRLAVLGNAVRLQDEPSSYILAPEGGGRLLRVFPEAGLAILLPDEEGAESGVPRFLRFLLPGRLWDRFLAEGRLADAAEETLAGRPTLVVPSPDSTWEERGLRHIYWLDTELRVPLRLEIHSRGHETPDVVSLEEISDPPSPAEMLPPEGVSLYSLVGLDPAEPPPGEAPFIPAALEGLERRQLSVLLGPGDENAGFRAFYRTEDARRFLSVVWVAADHPALLGPLGSLQAQPAPGWRLETPGWTALISTNLPRPKVVSWLTPPPAPPPEALEPAPEQPTQGGGYVCTTVVGSSQTRQWFVHEGLFESLVGDDRWQLLWLPRASLEKWADPEYGGWGQAPESPCLFGSATPDRVVLTIGGAARSPTQWVADISAAVAAAKERFPEATVVLQPVVGAPTAFCESLGRPVVAAENHRDISAAVKAVQGNGVEAGAVPRLAECSGYRDPLGHLEAAGLPGLARLLAAHYAATGP